MVVNFMKYFIAAMVFMSLTARAEEVVFKDCLTAEVDMDNLNALNSQALKLFPYILQESTSDEAIQTTPDEIVKKRAQLGTSAFSESEKAYRKLLENVDVYLSSGSVLIKS